MPFLIKIADWGIEGAASADRALAHGLSTLRGDLVHGPTAEAHGLPYLEPEVAVKR